MTCLEQLYLVISSQFQPQTSKTIDYDIYSSTENPNELVLVQLWSSKEAFDRHYNSPEASQFRETVMPLTVKPAQVKTYAEVGKIQ